jgi:D-glycero-alpha-D-manno-heptose 1-phosphate guanylyltransferase
MQRLPSRRPLSFEYDVFPELLSNGARVRVFECVAPFLDIGTDGSLFQADAFIQRHRRWFT